MKKFVYLFCIFVLAACSQEGKVNGPVAESTRPLALNGTSEIEMFPEEDTVHMAKAQPLVQKLSGATAAGEKLYEESFCPVKGTVIDTAKTQVFYIDTHADTLITLAGGVKVFIPQKAFRTKDSASAIPGKIKLSINAFNEVDEFLEAGLATVTTGQQLLETGGSLYMNATTGNNDTCALQPGKELQLAFPVKGERKEDMQLYRGEEEEEGFVEWSLDSDLYTMDSTLRQRKKGTRYEQFMDGNVSLEEYFAKNLFINPAKDPKNDIDHVYLTFDVAEQGKVQNAKVQGTEDPLLHNKLLNMVQFMPQWKPFQTVRGTRYDGVQEVMDITMGISVKLSIDRKKGKVILEEDNGTKVEGIARFITMEDYYVLTPRKELEFGLGWFNCDRRFGVDRPMASVFVQRDTSSKVAVFAVCRDLRGMVRGIKQKAGYRFNGLPEGEYIYIVSAKKSNDKTGNSSKYLLEIEPYISGRGPVGDKSWEWYSRGDMIKKLRSLWRS